MAVVSMSKKEFDRLEVLLGVRSGRLRVVDACELLDLKRRQVFRLLAGLKHGGAASLVSKRRGRPSNNRLPEAYRDLALSLVRERYADFGPTLAAEKLAEVHGCMISRETLRVWMSIGKEPGPRSAFNWDPCSPTGASRQWDSISTAVLEAPALVTGFDDVAVMSQSIQQRGCHFGIAEDARPFGEGEIGRDDDRGALV